MGLCNTGGRRRIIVYIYIATSTKNVRGRKGFAKYFIIIFFLNLLLLQQLLIMSLHNISARYFYCEFCLYTLMQNRAGRIIFHSKVNVAAVVYSVPWRTRTDGPKTAVIVLVFEYKLEYVKGIKRKGRKITKRRLSVMEIFVTKIIIIVPVAH